MKKKLNFKYVIFIALAVVCLFSSFKYYSYDNAKASHYVRIFEAKLNNHYYVIACSTHWYGGVSIIHSPNCKCK